MTTPFVEVTLRLRMEFDASVVLEGEDATLKAHIRAAMAEGGS